MTGRFTVAKMRVMDTRPAGTEPSPMEATEAMMLKGREDYGRVERGGYRT